MSRNRSRIGLCGPKSVHDHGDGISYFVTQDSTDLFSSRLMDIMNNFELNLISHF